MTIAKQVYNEILDNEELADDIGPYELLKTVLHMPYTTEEEHGDVSRLIFVFEDGSKYDDANGEIWDEVKREWVCASQFGEPNANHPETIATSEPINSSLP